jgi:hypothetical protein
MERAEELQESINTLKEHLNIPIFKNEDDEFIFIKAFFAKQEYLNDKERKDPLRIAVNDFQESLKNF